MELTEMLNPLHSDMDADEKRIIIEVLNSAFNSGCAITVHNGCETLLKQCSDAVKVFEEMYGTGVDALTFYRSGKPFGWVVLIYGNGLDVISDSSDNAETEAILKNADALNEEMSERKEKQDEHHS